GFLEYILELLEPSGGIASCRMFGGYAIRKNGLAIALVFDDEIYLKVDDSNRTDFESMGSKPFTYEKGGKIITISNWKVPIEILEDSEKLIKWSEKAYQVAFKAKKK
ncbi:MAG: TfoX/Sxy family protein, partial [Alphaproteobacteria bacterium]|nr:TfoX/Sxy family protein [Alphaproteobacteria bacterium]